MNLYLYYTNICIYTCLSLHRRDPRLQQGAHNRIIFFCRDEKRNENEGSVDKNRNVIYYSDLQ